MIRRDITRDVEKLRDEIAVELIDRNAYSKELSLAVTALEQAELWIIAHGRRTGTHLVIDKREYAEKLKATAEPATVETG